MGKAELTRSRIIHEARLQGTIRGYRSVSFADVADATSLSKSAVFKHFGAKEALERAVLEELCADFIERIWKPASLLPAGAPRLEAILNGWIAWVDGAGGDGGCGIIQAQIEFDDQPGPLRDYLREQQTIWNRVLAREFRAVSANIDATQAAFEFRSIVMGYNQSRRLLEDEHARKYAETAYRSLMERLNHGPGLP